MIGLMTTSSSVFGNEYPTQDIVRHVVNCMADNGGQNEENLYACTCRFDVLSSVFSFEEYETILAYLRNKSMSGETGAVFRNLGKRSRELVDRYASTEKRALVQCPVARRVTRTVKEE